MVKARRESSAALTDLVLHTRKLESQAKLDLTRAARGSYTTVTFTRKLKRAHAAASEAVEKVELEIKETERVDSLVSKASTTVDALVECSTAVLDTKSTC